MLNKACTDRLILSLELLNKASKVTIAAVLNVEMKVRACFKVLTFIALSFSNLKSRLHQLHRVMFPDVHSNSFLQALSETSEVPANECMSTTAGGLLVIHQAEEYAASFDALCTVFFIDTAGNHLMYIETVNGQWIEG